MKADTTFCTGLWHIRDNRKYGINHYHKLIPKTLAMLKDTNLVFFYEEDKVLEFVEQHKQSDNFLPIKVQIEDLPTFRFSDDYLESCKKQNNKALRRMKKQKGLVHYRRDYMKSGGESFKKVFSVWTSKVLLVDRMIDENPFNTSYFSWADISIARMNNKRRSWNFMDLSYDDNHIHAYRGRLYYLKRPVNVGAGFMMGHKDKWKELIPYYNEQLELSKNSNYAHDEETLLHQISIKKPDLFKKIV
jgi:hypothetical protein